MIDYHAHLAPHAALAEAVSRKFMPFPAEDHWPVALTDIAGHRAEMAGNGITTRYLSVPPILYGYELGAAEQLAHVQGLNDWVLEAASVPGFRPQGILPLGDADQTLAEIERLAGLGVTSVAIGSHIAGKPLDAVPDSVWVAAGDAFDFILLHPWKVRHGDLLGDLSLGNPIGNPVETTIAAARLISSGLLARVPKLTLLLAHGGGALPYVLGRFSHAWTAGGSRTPDPAAGARQMRYDTVLFDPAQLKHLVDVVGMDQVMLGTDSPFDMSVTDPAALIRAAGFDPARFGGDHPRRA